MKDIKRFVLAFATAMIAFFTMVVGLVVAIPLSIAAIFAGNRMLKKMEREMPNSTSGNTIEGEFSYIDNENAENNRAK
ncbi:hypothetical protein [Vibrio sp. HN007]|uniref:hypothetical protein n=1 Tax=Vibrio iocasae TaxID=3098914 RepID=UPI0035D49ABD